MRCCPNCRATLESHDWGCKRCGWKAGEVDGIPILAPALNSAELGFDPKQFSLLFSLEAGNFWFRARNALVVWALRRYFPRAESILELGCGTGFVTAAIESAFPHSRLVASEVFAQGAALARQRLKRAEVLQLDGRSLPFEAEFDVAGAFDVIEHIAEDEQVLSELRRSVRPGGGLILTVPQHQWLWSALDEFARHHRRYTGRGLAYKVERAGFKVARCTSFTTLVLPAMLASRLLRFRRSAHIDPMAEFRIPVWLNRTLEAVMALEATGIRAGISLPVGGSLLLVAYRP